MPNPSNNPGLVSDCETLLSARDTLAGTASLNWSATTAIYQWDGVGLDGTPQRVTALDLSHRPLTGRIPAELGSLSKLETLNLFDADLGGKIPPELGRLSNLEGLHLYGNRLSGGIPVELGNLSNLVVLDLGSNQLSGPIPTELARLSNLTRIELHYNHLEGKIPAGLGGLSDLIELSLGQNQLSGGIPPELADLANLNVLSLSNNRLNGEILPELGRLSNLTELRLGGNQLSGRIPLELTNLSNLKRLDLEHNQLSGEIPHTLDRLSNLIDLRLSDNELTGQIPSELGNLGSLTILSLDGNQLTGEIPSDLGQLADLTILHLGGNQLTGKVPSDLVRLADLTVLDLRNNQLTGEIPSDLGHLADLTLLLLGENKLTGQIPPELSRLSKLSWLLLNDNQLTGEIPSGLGRLSDLSLLHLHNNQLTGKIPSDLGRLADLRILHLRNNQLTGEIPEELGSLGNLGYLYVSGNKLTGCIPAGLRNLELDHDFYQLRLPYCDVLLNDLVVSPGPLAPSFDRYRADYTTEASTPIVTIHPTNRHGASLQVLGGDGHELADADDTAPGIQIDTGTVFTRVTIKVVAGDGGATRAYTIEIRRVLGAPTIAAIEAGGGYLAVSWVAPDEFAEARTASYDLRYIPTGDDESVDANWAVVENVPTYSAGGNLQYTITGLSAGTQYEVQLRAVDRSGEPVAWSASVTGTPTTPSACVTGGAVTGVLSAGIVSDCESLLAARDILAGSGRLNWSAGTPIKDWDGVTVGGTPPRVVGLSVNSRGLDGTIPAELGDLTGLRRLHLFENRLSGPIPAELGMLADLQALDLGENRLTGQIPVDLARLSNLRALDLGGNRLSGPIPSLLGDLDNLVEVDLSGNDMRGCAPPIPDQHGGPQCFADEGMTLAVDTSYLLRDDQLRVTSVGDASNGVVTLDGTTITYRHDGSETTTGGFTYTVTDSTQTMTFLVAIAVSPVNDPPVGVMDALAVQEGGAVSVEAQQLLGNDSDAEGDPVSITAVGDVTNGLVTLDGTTIVYRHDGSETTTGSFTYTVTDGTDSTTALVTISVRPVNDPPIGVDDALAVQEGDTVSIASQQLLANDTDPERDKLTITAVGDATNGLVALDGDAITYWHDGSETKTGSFTYTVTDGAESATASVAISITPVNDRPSGVDDALAVEEGGTVSVQAIELLANDTDAEGDTLSITAVGGANNGLVTLDGSTVFYRHDGTETTSGSFAYTVSDGIDSTTALVTVAVRPVNDPPTGVDDALAVAEGGTVTIRAQQLLGNDSDAEGDALRITAHRDAINGLVTLDGNTIVYVHDGSETTLGGFTYTVTDGADTATAVVTITVSPVNDPPVGVEDAIDVREGATLAFQTQLLLFNDSDAEGDALSITAVGDAVNGVVTLDGGTISYAHDDSETTAGSFTYTVTDGTDTATVLVTITVAPVTDPPVFLLMVVALGVGLLTLAAVLAMWIRRTKEAD